MLLKYPKLFSFDQVPCFTLLMLLPSRNPCSLWAHLRRSTQILRVVPSSSADTSVCLSAPQLCPSNVGSWNPKLMASKRPSIDQISNLNYCSGRQCLSLYVTDASTAAASCIVIFLFALTTTRRGRCCLPYKHRQRS